ncbi:HNH endonuclease [Klebsiella phage vB_KpnM_KB57]|uniref:Putative anti-sigma factor n=1 Tax=Klebsiella phage vB_KpnM_KB57 TaxID=1719140 RepID=A0A0S1RVI3_9CAUD|nr:HNH endonuclease [Klebsiella phage vB_KpnM_KB57]ALM02609.1 putative anti-sigma factor [Klebsiella phage vB_KpnM_KB57]
MFDIKKKFTNSEIKSLEERYHKKVERTKKRGLEFSLTLDDWFMMGEKLLGIGPCDYTNMNFSTRSVHGEKDPLYPTVERIDDKKGYVRGNVCVVLQRANELKDRLVDKKTAITIIDPLDREIVQAMILNMSKDHLEKLKTKYIPQQETKMDMKEHMAKVEKNHNTDYKELAEHEHKQPHAAEETTAPVEVEAEPKEAISVALPEDVAVALAYANYCNTFANVGMKVSVTYAQFKAKYIRSTCAMTGEKLTGEPKSILILDLNIGFAKDNFIIVSKKMETAMTQLMIQTGLSYLKLQQC